MKPILIIGVLIAVLGFCQASPQFGYTTRVSGGTPVQARFLGLKGLIGGGLFGGGGDGGGLFGGGDGGAVPFGGGDGGAVPFGGGGGNFGGGGGDRGGNNGNFVDIFGINRKDGRIGNLEQMVYQLRRDFARLERRINAL